MLEVETGSIQMPASADKLQIFFFQSTSSKINPSFDSSNPIIASRCYMETTIELEGAIFTSGLSETNNAAKLYFNHNLTVPNDVDPINLRESTLPLTKLFTADIIDNSGQVNIKLDTIVRQGYAAGTVAIYRPIRLFILPFRTTDL